VQAAGVVQDHPRAGAALEAAQAQVQPALAQGGALLRRQGGAAAVLVALPAPLGVDRLVQAREPGVRRQQPQAQGTTSRSWAL
jgi:hypothetical protein